ncbi:TNF superfamily member 12 [Latimeria chalumnae]|uniref:TNF superfamily member 12 n=1 Tax=Latimeria chalumnae TaxID=7897 RepID=M3XLK9_LATCH|nr:TNF superfamily member 12 [Latimeria chalumnae]|eukprot:XP_005999828.1 PREDICTED: tumor necrosis factor ligand superfamily member 12 [Latimeria chalumnae]
MHSSVTKKKKKKKGLLCSLLLLTGLAVCLALCSLLLAAFSWGKAQSLSLSFQSLQNSLQQTDFHREWGHGPEELLYYYANRSDLPRRRTARSKDRKRKRKNKLSFAAHYEVKTETASLEKHADPDGIIRDWAAIELNTTNPLTYDNSKGEFTVTKDGLYYLYCQVHYKDGKSIYVKLDILLNNSVVFRCLQEFSSTAGPGEDEVKDCHVSGLVLLHQNAVLQVKTLRNVNLKIDKYLTYFGLFLVP